MRYTTVEEDRFYNSMRGDFTLQNVVGYISTAFRVEDVFPESELREWCLDNDYCEKDND